MSAIRLADIHFARLRLGTVVWVEALFLMTRSPKSQKTAGEKVADAIAPVLKAQLDMVADEALPNTLMALLVRSEFKESEERIKARLERLRREPKDQARSSKKLG
jgi:hypothetical protein